MVHPSTLVKLKYQLDKNGRLVFPGLQTAEQTIGGYKVHANPFLPALPASVGSPTTYKGTLCFGDFSKFVIRLATPAVLRLEQLYGAALQVGFMAYTRFDSNIVDGGGGAIQFLNSVYQSGFPSPQRVLLPLRNRPGCASTNSHGRDRGRICLCPLSSLFISLEESIGIIYYRTRCGDRDSRLRHTHFR